MGAFLAVAGVSMWALSSFDAGLRSGTCSARGLDTSHTYTVEQTRNAATISAVAVDRGLPPRAASIALATAYQESKLENIDYGDRDSLGLFQQRPSQGWGTAEQIMDPVYASHAFYEVLETIPDYENMPVTQAAQAVQRSAYPSAYADHEIEGRLFASALTGRSGGELQCDLAAPVGPGHPQEMSDRVGAEFSRLSAEGRVTTSLGTADDGAPQTAGPTTLVMTAPDEATGWALANWAVAHAAHDHVVAVDYQSKRWDRARPASESESQWVDTDATPRAEPTVIVYFSASGRS